MVDKAVCRWCEGREPASDAETCPVCKPAERCARAVLLKLAVPHNNSSTARHGIVRDALIAYGDDREKARRDKERDRVLLAVEKRAWRDPAGKSAVWFEDVADCITPADEGRLVPEQSECSCVGSKHALDCSVGWPTEQSEGAKRSDGRCLHGYRGGVDDPCPECAEQVRE